MQKIILTTVSIVIAVCSLAQTNASKNKPKTTATKAIKPMATAIPADAVHFTVSNQETAEINSTDKAIVIDGNENKITITGNCKQLFITGKNNDIVVESLDAIEITGSGNFVSWEKSTNASGKPVVNDKGGYNNVGKKSGDALNKSDN